MPQRIGPPAAVRKTPSVQFIIRRGQRQHTAIKSLMTGPFAPSSAWDTACYQSGGIPIAATTTELMQSALYPRELQNQGAPSTTPPGGTPAPTPPPGGGSSCGSGL